MPAAWWGLWANWLCGSQMMSKVDVNGSGKDPLFAFLQKTQPGMMSFVLGTEFSW